MVLNERQRARMRSALEAVLRAEDAVHDVADELARQGYTVEDAALDRAAELLQELVPILERLASGRG
ncbi:MAG: hypothetical protein C4290_07580 [Chloroflexota bacterium]